MDDSHADDPWDLMQDFLAGRRYAVVGASADRAKYGNKVLRAYMQAGREAVPVHPSAATIEGRTAYASLGDVPDVSGLDGVSIVTPPAVTERVVRDAIRAGVTRLWMQPGAESPSAIAEARAAGLMVLADGPCVLVALGYRESDA